MNIKFSISRYPFDKNDINEIFSDVPQEERLPILRIGTIELFNSIPTDKNLPEYVDTNYQISTSWIGNVFIDTHGRIWVYAEDYIHIAANNLYEFLLISPSKHYRRDYYTKW